MARAALVRRAFEDAADVARGARRHAMLAEQLESCREVIERRGRRDRPRRSKQRERNSEQRKRADCGTTDEGGSSHHTPWKDVRGHAARQWSGRGIGFLLAPVKRLSS